MKRFLMRLVCLPVIAAVLAMVLGTFTSVNAAPAAPVVLAPVVQLVVQSAPVAPAAPAAATYTVVKGEVLGEIAAKHDYPGGWRALHGCNRDVIGPSPHRIKPGMVLNLTPCSNSPESSNERSDNPEPQVDSGSELTASGGSNGVSVADHHWDRLAQCESGGHGLWRANTGNSFYGGLQFTRSTWKAFGGHEYAPNAHQASREEQIAVAERTVDAQGWKAWPACTKKLGMRGVRH